MFPVEHKGQRLDCKAKYVTFQKSNPDLDNFDHCGIISNQFRKLTMIFTIAEEHGSVFLFILIMRIINVVKLQGKRY